MNPEDEEKHITAVNTLNRNSVNSSRNSIRYMLDNFPK
jgi:hypothetical protein